MQKVPELINLFGLNFTNSLINADRIFYRFTGVINHAGYVGRMREKFVNHEPESV